jgi:hypothetical protein
MNSIRAVFEDGVAGNPDVYCDAEASESANPLQTVMSVARRSLERIRSQVEGVEPIFTKGRIEIGSLAPSPSVMAGELLKVHPIPVEPGFEGNAGISGGAWPNDDGDQDDALVYLRFSEGTVDLPLHVHEFFDRFIAVADGFGLFHYMPGEETCGELRSLVVQAGDVVVFTRGLMHTFTAPIEGLTLLSYHTPFLAFDDARQFTIPARPVGQEWTWNLPSTIICPCADRRAWRP